MRNVKQERPRAIRVLLLHPEDSPLQKSIGDYFNHEDRFPIMLIGATSVPERCRSLVNEIYPDILLLVDVEQTSEWTTRLFQLSKDINLDQANIATVALTDSKPEDMLAYYDKALSAGVRGVVNVGRLGEGMVGAFSEIERCIMQAYEFIRYRSATGSAFQAREQKVITLASGKGGVGKSTLAAALASEIARQRLDKRVLLIDFDIQYGALAPMLGITKPRNTLAQLATLSVADIANLQGHNDIANFVQILAVGNSANLHLLPAPTSPLEVAGLSPENASEILSTMRRAFDYLVIDLPTQITDAALAAFQSSDLLLLVCEPEVLAVRACRQLLQLLRDPTIGNPQAEIKLILNKVWNGKSPKSVGTPLIKAADVEKLFDEPLLASFPLEATFVNEHISSGKPIGSWETKNNFLKELTHLYQGLGLGAEPNGKGGQRPKPEASQPNKRWGRSK
ncbi:MAG: AAA family ATPase [Caldilineaceae bacterium]